MNIYLISEAYEGCAEIAFSSLELAEQYLIDSENYSSDVVEVILNEGFSRVCDTPRLDALRKIAEEESRKAHLEFLANSVCDVCGVKGYKACECYAEVSCGSFGGVTKKGSACLNSVLKREGKRCYLHA